MRGEDTIGARSYKDAGVNIDAGAALVETIRPLAEDTARPGVVGGLGGFGGLFDLAAAGFRDPILVAATDGVGTKLKLATTTGIHRGIGVDLVAMCVNDLVVQGAEPLFFLDYFATGRLEAEVAADVMAGIADGCRQAGCALIGGETAEMPGMYTAGDYDVAGFAVGAVERGGLLTGTAVAVGDVVLGLASGGVHANGFSLVRQVLDDSGARTDEPAPFAPDTSLGAALLTPTRIYVAACLAALKATENGVHAFAHITGGGLTENIPRVLPETLAVALDGKSWTASPVFAWLAENGIADDEMARTFNCGIGMIVICAPDAAGAVTAALSAAGETVYAIGHVTKRNSERPTVQIAGLEATWQN